MTADGAVAEFRIPMGNRVLGFLVYGLAGAAMSLLGGAVAFAGVAGGLFALFPFVERKSDAGAGGLLILGVGLVAGVTVAVWLAVVVLRMYRRKAGGTVRIWQDRIEVSQGSGPPSLSYEELDQLEYWQGRKEGEGELYLRSGEGRRILLSSPWPLNQIFQQLQQWAVPVQVRRLKERLDRGDSVLFRERPRRAVLALAWGAAFGAFGAWMTVLLLSHPKAQESIPWIGFLRFSLLPAVVSVTSILWGIRLLRNGLAISRTGLRTPGSEVGPETPWIEVTRMHLGPREMRLEGATLERPYRLSRGAPNFSALVSLAPQLTPLEVRTED